MEISINIHLLGKSNTCYFMRPRPRLKMAHSSEMPPNIFYIFCSISHLLLAVTEWSGCVYEVNDINETSDIIMISNDDVSDAETPGPKRVWNVGHIGLDTTPTTVTRVHRSAIMGTTGHHTTHSSVTYTPLSCLCVHIPTYWMVLRHYRHSILSYDLTILT